ncbi:Multiple RNA-binding domain-containing protein 1 [Auxenochlorella protothecoides]|uniref:Multiple RNA-binding domain-containing protein 1 n=2 Tax=Auxenochlorella protothecoides TaxID=3075 RepID=A0A087SNP2_AUXPR|nr:Multiple RNA-binding domain-containing protein 1 [Auxenochlorella protothecoides]KFM27346.1 Multiple RNA-binding domain-containing protein 1 [Auxenochlorella protothecoides]
METQDDPQKAVERPPCSRLCIKNLPKYVDEARLKEHFSAKGEVTDAKIVRTRDGKSRCFGFIGYRLLDDAVAAFKYFSRSYMDTFQLEIEYAQQYGRAATEHRPWSKHTPGSSAHDKAQAAKPDVEPAPLKAREAIKAAKTKAAAGKKAPEEADPKLAEFLELMAPRSKKATWSNDDAVAAAAGSASAAAVQQAVQGSDDEEYEDLEAEKDRLVVDATVSHLDYLKARRKAAFSDDEDEGEEFCGAADSDEEELEAATGPSGGSEAGAGTSGSDAASDEEGDEAASEGAPEPDPGMQHASQTAEVSDTGRLFVRNLPYAATDDELRELFTAYGEVEEVHIVKDRATRQSKGFAHVLFSSPAAAVAAQAGADGAIFQGRLLHVLPGRPAPKTEEEGPSDAKSFKEERARSLKAGAGTNRAAWNSLFVRPDTVAEAVAAHFGITKSALLDRESSDVAVRMALGEAQVFAATKAALSDAGVDVDALEAAAAAAGKQDKGPDVARSDRAILIKNLPWSTSEDELQSLFAESGEVARFVLPDTKALAVIEFEDASDAKRAFRRLAYKPYHHVPLYLEWAPRSIFSGTPKPKAAKVFEAKAVPAATLTTSPAIKPEAGLQATAAAAVLPEDTEADSVSIYVKNLAWATTDKGLHAHFAAAAEAKGAALRSARVARKAGPDGKPLSAGYGFVECATEAAARELIGALQGSVLDGHKLMLQLSQKRDAQEGKGGVPANLGTKIVVRNVAFEATRKDVLGLFSSFGDVKSCRLPRKFDGTHRRNYNRKGSYFDNGMSNEELRKMFSSERVDQVLKQNEGKSLDFNSFVKQLQGNPGDKK